MTETQIGKIVVDAAIAVHKALGGVAWTNSFVRVFSILQHIARTNKVCPCHHVAYIKVAEGQI